MYIISQKIKELFGVLIDELAVFNYISYILHILTWSIYSIYLSLD